MNPYRCTFQMGMEKALEYRVNFILSLLSAVFPIIIQTFLWNYLYGNSDAASMTGYSYSQIMVYTLLAAMVSHLVYTGFEYQVNQDIKNGGLNKYLVRPVNYRSYQFFSFLGEKAPQLLILLAVAAALLVFSVFTLGLVLSLPRVLAFLTSLVLALVLNFFIFYCVALISFWLTDVNLLFGTVSVVLVVVSGGIFPMDIFGERIAFLINLLPFGYTTQFPVNIINGRFGLYETAVGFICQIFWIICFGMLGGLLWKRGLRRYTAVGG
nr:ABC-2 family transporter protein [uncultured Eisenbergiella sp.]